MKKVKNNVEIIEWIGNIRINLILIDGDQLVKVEIYWSNHYVWSWSQNSSVLSVWTLLSVTELFTVFRLFVRSLEQILRFPIFDRRLRIGTAIQFQFALFTYWWLRLCYIIYQSTIHIIYNKYIIHMLTFCTFDWIIKAFFLKIRDCKCYSFLFAEYWTKENRLFDVRST